jgi:hypothetical protein
MSSQRKIKASEIVSEVRSGTDNYELMDKYQLSARGLKTIFEKLVATGLIKRREIADRMPLYQDPVVPTPIRVAQRSQPSERLPIYDLDDMTADCYVSDISLTGVQIVGIKAAVGEKRNFLLQPRFLTGKRSISFRAECRWAEAHQEETHSKAGFEIKKISSEALRVLARLLSEEADKEPATADE